MDGVEFLSALSIFNLNNNFTQTYEIISSVIIKSDEDAWNAFCEKNKNSFEKLKGRYTEHAIFNDATEEDMHKVLYGCFPLHPVSTFILPRLSERVAQNERTLFTFLSSNGASTLPAYLKGKQWKKFGVITPDMIFDYFEPLFQKEPISGELHKNYILTMSILEKIRGAALECKIVKTISLIYILGQFEKLKPTKEELVGIFSVDYSAKEINEAITRLIEKDYVIYLKRSNDYLKT